MKTVIKITRNDLNKKHFKEAERIKQGKENISRDVKKIAVILKKSMNEELATSGGVAS